MSTVSVIGNLNVAVSDVQYSRHGGVFRPNYGELLEDLYELTREDALLPRSYQTNALRPLIAYLEAQKEPYFNKLFQSGEEDLNISEKGIKKAIEEVSEALLQRNHNFKYYSSSFNDLKAFQAVVTTLFDDMLATGDALLTQQALAPLAKWGPPTSGPYAWPNSSTSMKEIGVRTGIVNLPAVHQTGGLLAWATLGHEVAGHHFLRSFDNLIAELADAVDKLFKERKEEQGTKWDTLSDYWRACTEETACDVLGTLNIGPSFGAGLIGYFRGARRGKLLSSGSLYSTKAGVAKNALILSGDTIGQIFLDKISSDVKLEKANGVLGYQEAGSKNPIKYQKYNSLDKHPLDVLRPFVIARVIDLFQPTSPLAQLIRDEAVLDLGDKREVTLFQLEDKGTKVLTPLLIPMELAIKTAETAAEALANSSIKCLGDKKLIEIFQWKEVDELLTEELMEFIDKPGLKKWPELGRLGSARHIVAASVLRAVHPLTSGGEASSMNHIEIIFNNMKNCLFDAFEKIPQWHAGQHVTNEPLPPSGSEEAFEEVGASSTVDLHSTD